MIDWVRASSAIAAGGSATIPNALTTAPSTTSDRPGRDGVEWEGWRLNGFIGVSEGDAGGALRTAHHSLYMYLPNASRFIHNEREFIQANGVQK